MQRVLQNTILEGMEKIATRGRPREFCPDEALTAALQVFWTKGYEGASLSDLTEAMGITRPSLYAAFGNKESLFRQALDLYQREKMAYIGEAMREPSARAVAKYMLHGAVETATGGECRGCMGVISAVACQSVEPSIREDVNERTEAAKSLIIERMQQAIDADEFVVPAEADGIARYLLAIVQGISVQAQSGGTRAELMGIAEAALAAWPSK